MKSISPIQKASGNLWTFILFVIAFFSSFSVLAQKCENDTLPPVISLNTADTFNHPVNTRYKPVLVFVEDDCSDSASISLVLTSNVNPYVLGLYTERYVATDEAGNKQLKIRYVRVLDDVKPVITYRYKKDIWFLKGHKIKEPWSDYLIITDNYNAPVELIQNLIEIDNDVDLNRAGYYHISFSTHDNSGNVAEVFVLNVNVQSPEFDGIHTEQTKIMNIFPNPSYGNVSLSLEGVLTEHWVLVEIWDAFGKSLRVMNLSTNDQHLLEIDLTNQPKGMYSIRLTTPSLIITQPLILQ